MTTHGKSADEAAFLGQVGVRVRRARSRAGMTRRTLAQRSGVSERYLAQLEGGDGNVSILLIRRVAVALGADLLELIGQHFDAGRRARIALVGLRGAGKTTLGAALAERLQAPFFELTGEVARDLDVPIETLLAGSDRDAYRAGEQRTLLRLIEQNARCVIACGGSIVIEPQTWQLARSRCFSIWLRAAPDDHLNRIIASGNLRSVTVREHALIEVRTILAHREHLYAQADATLDTGLLDPERSLQDLLALTGESAPGQ
jgi:XRE family aerobic/anaerobic benzoate catabolism transcriptional regulator